MTIEKCKMCDRYNLEKDRPRNWLYCKVCCDNLAEYENEKMAEYEAWLEKKIAWGEVYEELVKNNLFCGNYNTEHESLAYMRGISEVMEYIAYEAGRYGEFEKMFWENIVRSGGRDE